MEERGLCCVGRGREVRFRNGRGRCSRRGHRLVRGEDPQRQRCELDVREPHLRDVGYSMGTEVRKNVKMRNDC